MKVITDFLIFPLDEELSPLDFSLTLGLEMLLIIKIDQY